jgi:hypothetical protein
MARGATTLGRKLLMTSRALLNGLLLVVLFGVPLFLPAGTLRFWNAWAFLGIFAGCFVTILI